MDLDIVTESLEAMLAANRIELLDEELIIELHDLLAFNTNEMLVVHVPVNMFVVGFPIAHPELPNEAAINQEIECTIN